jgi:large subunit ribosomal protein L16
MLLQPKKQKHRKWQKGRSRNRMKETRGVELSFGSYGLKALEAAWVTSAQIEAARKVIAKALKKTGKSWVRIFPDKPVTKLPPEVTLGGGKGNVDHFVFPVKPGRILFEIDGVDKKTAHSALKGAAYKLPVKSKIVEK